MTARLGDIATHAGVSVATASRVLNGRPGVSEAARRRVLTAVDVLGYERPTGLQSRRVGLIGVVIAELENPIFPVFAQAIDRALPSFGYTALMSTRQLGVSAEQGSIDLLLEHGVSGMIFVSGIHSDAGADVSHYRALREQGIPLAFVNGPRDDLDATFVGTDDAAGMHTVVDHLVALGHRRLGLATGPTRYTPSARKLAAFRAAVARHGLEPEVHVGDWTVEGGQAAGRVLAGAGVTGIVCASDLTAVGVVRGVRAVGLTVPRDVSVTGHDGAPITAYLDPALTTLRQPVDRLVAAAVRSLLDDIDGTPGERDELLVEPELVVRASTGAAPRPRTAPRVDE